MSWSNVQKRQSFVFWDPSGNGNPLAAFQSVSLATAAEVAAAVAAGFSSARVGATVVPTPITTGAPTRRVMGISAESAVNGKNVSVVIDGIAEVMVNAAVALDSLLFPAAAATRTTSQTPLTNLPQVILPPAPDVPLTYNLCLADDTAIVAASTGANALYYPIGYALEVAAAQYTVIPVRLHLAPFYA
jgi:hypothetical protein